jgi:hypothetical protein
MPQQGAVLTDTRVVHERHHGGKKALRSGRDQVGRTVTREQLTQLSVVDRKMRWHVHQILSSSHSVSPGRRRTGALRNFTDEIDKANEDPAPHKDCRRPITPADSWFQVMPVLGGSIHGTASSLPHFNV